MAILVINIRNGVIYYPHLGIAGQLLLL